MKAVRRILLATALMGMLAMSSGCQAIGGKATEKAIENASGNKVDIEQDGITVEGENGEQAAFGEKVDVPDDFPKDVPVYKGTVTGALSAEGSWTLSIETKDDIKTVMAFYADELEDEGWVKESSVDTGDGGMYSAKKDDRQCTVITAADGGETEGMSSVTVSVGLK